MAVEAFLNRLVKYGEDKGLFLKMPIKDIPESCCDEAVTQVYDFDKCKEIIADIHRLNSPKSCDALKIIANKNTIDFIEFKGWKKFIEWQLGNADEEEKIEAQIKKFRLDEKIIDSLFVLKTMIEHPDFRLTKAEKRAYIEATKRFVVLVDLEDDPLKELTITLGALAITSSPVRLIKEKMDEMLEEISDNNLINLQRPLLKTCSTIDKFYADAKIP